MALDYESFNLVVASIVRRITSDQLIIEHCLSTDYGDSANLSPNHNEIILRNKFNIDLLNQIIYIGQNIDSAEGTITSLMAAFDRAAQADRAAGIKITPNRNRPLLNVISDRDIIASVVKVIILLIILEDLSIKKIAIDLRCRSGYVSVRIKGGRVSDSMNFGVDIVEFINTLLIRHGGSLRWRKSGEMRLVYMRLSLSNQIPFSYNG